MARQFFCLKILNFLSLNTKFSIYVLLNLVYFIDNIITIIKFLSMCLQYLSEIYARHQYTQDVGQQKPTLNLSLRGFGGQRPPF